MTTIIGISSHYHDSAMAIVQDGHVRFAAQEERFSRIKNDASFPAQALTWGCEEAGIRSLSDIDYIVYYEKPLIKFERLLETWLRYAPKGMWQFSRAMPSWIKHKLLARRMLEQEIRKILPGKKLPTLLFSDHHRSHAASAFFPGPFREAAVLCLDGVGEWDTSTAWVGRENVLEPLWRIPFPHSLGLLYSAFTSFCGFRVNSGEYKLMGLAPYGEPCYADLIEEELITIREDGSFFMNMRYFDYSVGARMTNRHFANLFGGKALPLDEQPTIREMNLAASIQKVTEKIVTRMARQLKEITQLDSLCLGGGVALNCVANGALQRSGLFKEIWVPPSPGDAGSAIGAALAVWHEYLLKPRYSKEDWNPMEHAYIGPSWGDSEIERVLESLDMHYERLADRTLFTRLAGEIANGKVVGWFQGGMEFGPRALGNRSILADPRDANMIRRLNQKIKKREAFRPFAPSVLEEKAHEWFDIPAEKKSAYMHTVATVSQKIEPSPALLGLEKIHQIRSKVPAITHIDYSARIQTVSMKTNPRFYTLIKEFEKMTGIPMLINTSFNVRGEPIVLSPKDAVLCFIHTDMDILAIGNYVLYKNEQNSKIMRGNNSVEFERD